MAPPLVPSPVLRAARPRRVLLAGPGLVPAPVTLPVLDLGTKPGLVEADLEAALALVPAAVAAAVAVINPALVLATRPALAPAINLAEAVGTKSRFGDE